MRWQSNFWHPLRGWIFIGWLLFTAVVGNPTERKVANRCWCNSDDKKCTSTLEAPAPATGTCRDHNNGCVYEYEHRGGARLNCAKQELADVTEYSVLNGRVYNLHHVCHENLCLPEFALSVLDCPWVMAPSDRKGQLRLKCKCNQGANCKDGECSFDEDRIPSDMAAACRYWEVEEWSAPIIDCWYSAQAYDRQVFVDSRTKYIMCRDSNYCNDKAAVHETLSGSNHCPLFAVSHFNKAVNGATKPNGSTPPTVDQNGEEIEYAEIQFSGTTQTFLPEGAINGSNESNVSTTSNTTNSALSYDNETSSSTMEDMNNSTDNYATDLNNTTTATNNNNNNNNNDNNDNNKTGSKNNNTPNNSVMVKEVLELANDNNNNNNNNNNNDNALSEVGEHSIDTLSKTPSSNLHDIEPDTDKEDFDDYADYENENVETYRQYVPSTKAPTADDLIRANVWSISGGGRESSRNNHSDAENGFGDDSGIRHWSTKLTAVTLSFGALVIIFIIAVLVYACSLVC